MRYKVRWKRDAIDQLADLWAQAADRAAVTAAANEIDRLLERGPESKGESRPNNRRVLIEPPLVAVFKVIEEKQIVRVLSVRGLPGRILRSRAHSRASSRYQRQQADVDRFGRDTRSV